MFTFSTSVLNRKIGKFSPSFVRLDICSPTPVPAENVSNEHVILIEIRRSTDQSDVDEKLISLPGHLFLEVDVNTEHLQRHGSSYFA